MKWTLVHQCIEIKIFIQLLLDGGATKYFLKKCEIHLCLKGKNAAHSCQNLLNTTIINEEHKNLIK